MVKTANGGLKEQQPTQGVLKIHFSPQEWVHCD